MIKKNKWKCIVSSLVILAPILIGFLLWNQLPDTMPIHWNASGEADGFCGKLWAIITVPLILLVGHWIALLVTFADPKNKDQSKKAIGLIFWIAPGISLFSAGLTYSLALGIEFGMERALPIMIAVMFISMGNYLPKVTQNSTFGIKVIWALNNEENWNATHRFGGKVWVITGFVLLFSILFPEEVFVTTMFVVIVVAAALPILYSYCYYRKQKKAGTYIPTNYGNSRFYNVSKKASSVILVGAVVLCAVLFFTGDIEFHCGETAMQIEADYWKDLEISYDSIDGIEYLEEKVPGVRTNGFGSPRLLMGTFKNEEFGYYTRYSYTKCDSAIIIRDGEEVLVLSGENVSATRELYEELLQHID